MVTWGPSTTTTFGTSTPASTTPSAAPAAGGFMFGGAAAGGGAPSTPPLTPAPAIGNPPPLNTGFSFGGSANAAPAPSGGLFGAPAPAPSGGLFGSNPAPAPSGGLFGSTPAPAPSGGLFRSNPAPAPSGGLFGASAPAPSGGLFGSSAPAPSGGLFGSSAPAPSDGLFGASAPAPSGGLFGSFTSAPSGSLFGTPAPAATFGAQPTTYAQNPHQAAYHAHQSASAQQETARIEEAISNLQSKYSSAAPGAPTTPNSQCAFTAILYDALSGDQRNAMAAYTTSGGSTSGILNNQMSSMSLSATIIPKPPHISQKVWNEAQARNPNHSELTPVALVGASSLHSRLVSHQTKTDELATQLSTVKQYIEVLNQAAIHSRQAIRRASYEQEALQRRLLEIMRKTEIVRCMGQPVQAAEREGMERMERLLRDVNVLTRGVVDVEERGREQSRQWKRRAVSTVNTGGWSIEKEDKEALMEVLKEQKRGLDGLEHIVKRDERDVGILKEELEKAYHGGSGGVGERKKSIVVGEGGVAIFTGQ